MNILDFYHLSIYFYNSFMHFLYFCLWWNDCSKHILLLCLSSVLLYQHHKWYDLFLLDVNSTCACQARRLISLEKLSLFWIFDIQIQLFAWIDDFFLNLFNQFIKIGLYFAEISLYLHFEYGVPVWYLLSIVALLVLQCLLFFSLSIILSDHTTIFY